LLHHRHRPNLLYQDVEKVRQCSWKVTAEAKVEQTRTCSTLNLNLSIALADFFSILIEEV